MAQTILARMFNATCRARMAEAILALPVTIILKRSEWFLHFQVQYLSAMHNGLSHSGPVSCILLVCMNGSSHSGTANNI